MTINQQLVVNNFIKKIDIYAQIIDGKVIKTDEWVIASLNIPANTFNVLMPRSAQIKCLKQLNQLIRQVPFKGYPLSVWIKSEYLRSDWRSFFQVDRYAEIERNAMMIHEGKKIRKSDQKISTELTITKITEKVDVIGYMDVFIGLFAEQPDKVAIQKYKELFSQLKNYENVQMYVGYVGEIAVTTGLMIESEDSYGIYDLMTKEKYRGRGYGSCMVQFLLDQTDGQGKPVVLQASEDGIRIYQRFGFVEVGEILVYE